MFNFFGESISLVDRNRNKDVLWIPIQWPTLSKYIGISKGFYHYVGGDAGSGKSAFVDQAYILGPYKWVRNNPQEKVNLKIFAWKLERPVPFTKLKWISSELWDRYKILISPKDLAGFGSSDTIDKDLYDKIITITKDLSDMDETIEVYGGDNPTGIWRKVTDFFKANGKFKTIKNKSGMTQEVYVPNDPNLLVIVVVDHMGLLKTESDRQGGRTLSKKELMDRMSSYFQEFRDRYGAFCVGVNQFNRGKEDPIRRSKFGISPTPADFDSTSQPYHDCDVAIGLIDPTNYGEDKYAGYLIPKLTTPDGISRFRGLHIMKNNYDQDNINCGFAFMGENGKYYQLMPSSEMTETAYRKVQYLGIKE